MTSVDDFEAAKSVADLLKGMDAERQIRILRWVSESLGITQVLPQQREPASVNPMPDLRSPLPSVGATDIKSFVASKDPKSDNQFAATVAYFYRFAAPQHERRDSITAEVLQEATRLAGRARLGDPGKTLRNAKDTGYLDATDRGEFKINTVGENLVAMTLPGTGRATTAKVAKKQSRNKKTKR
jgi:hypothetical protein